MPATIYRNAAKKRVPSVTTINNILGFNKGALIHWSWEMGCDGKDYREVADGAATIGTVAHNAVEASVKKQTDFDIDALDMPPEDRAKVKRCWEAWCNWKEQSKLEIFQSELSLVSEVHQFGGTMDCVGISSKRCIIDLKTGSGVFPEMLLQLSAYGALYNEIFPDEPIEEFHLIRVGKEDASFHHHCWPDLSLAWECFLMCRKLYDAHKILKKMV